MKKQDQKHYDKIVSIILTDNNYCDKKKRYVSDLKDSFLFYYPETGKILELQKNSLKTIYRYKDVCWALNDKLESIINQLEK